MGIKSFLHLGGHNQAPAPTPDNVVDPLTTPQAQADVEKSLGGVTINAPQAGDPAPQQPAAGVSEASLTTDVNPVAFNVVDQRPEIDVATLPEAPTTTPSTTEVTTPTTVAGPETTAPTTQPPATPLQ